jgi:hypothetical protein
MRVFMLCAILLVHSVGLVEISLGVVHYFDVQDTASNGDRVGLGVGNIYCCGSMWDYSLSMLCRD